MLDIQWFGHSMWRITDSKVTIITDPFTDIGYKMPKNLEADIVLSSHDHFDHNNISLIKGNPEVVNTEGSFSIKGIDIKTFQIWHDKKEGADRGKNLLMKFTIDGKTILHCGDIGHKLNQETAAKIGNIDIIFIPVGGYYTIDAKEAKETIELLKPTIVFPMHYKTEVLDFPIAKKDEFLKIANNVTELNSNSIAITDNDFKARKTIFLNYE